MSEFSPEPQPIREKENRYAEMFGGKPEAIFVLSGSITHHENSGRFTSSSYKDSDAYGILGGKARVIAAAEIGQYFPESILVTNSQSFESEHPSSAAVMADELKNYGIQTERIIKQDNSVTTLTEIIEMTKLAKQNGWSHIGIITNDYHLERAQALYDHLQELTNNDATVTQALEYCQANNVQIKFVAAEDILPMRDPRYAGLIEQARQTDEYKKRLRSEKIGVDHILNGTYLTNTGIKPNIKKT